MPGVTCESLREPQCIAGLSRGTLSLAQQRPTPLGKMFPSRVRVGETLREGRARAPAARARPAGP